MASLTTTILQATSITTALVAAGGIATLTLFDVPILQAQPASRSLPSIRWLFSRGSHIFPTAAFLSAAGFGGLAIRALPVPLSQLARIILRRKPTAGLGLAAFARTNGYLAAGLLCISIAPWTSLVMIPNNFAIIQLNADKDGSRSSQSAKALSKSSGTRRTAENSVDGEGEANQWTDLSGPQERTPKDTTAGEDERVRSMLDVFAKQNMARALLMTAGGVAGLVTALM